MEIDKTMLSILKNITEFMRRKKLNNLLKSFASIGEYIVINWGTVNEPENIKVKKNYFIGTGFRFVAKGDISIGSTNISANATIHSSNHVYESTSHLQYGRLILLKPVTIDDHCWVGDNVMVWYAQECL